MNTLDSSASKNSVLVQIQTSIDNAVAVSKAAYQSVDLANKPTPLDVRHEFASLTATTAQATSTLNAFPAEAAQGEHVLDAGPKGVAFCAALARTTEALKSLPGRVSHEDGVALLNSYEEVASNSVLMFSALNARAGSFEHGAPGLVDYGLNRFTGLFQELTAALSTVLPPTMNLDKVQGLHTNIQTAIKGVHSFSSK